MIDREELRLEIKRNEYEKLHLVVWTQLDEFRLQVMKELQSAQETLQEYRESHGHKWCFVRTAGLVNGTQIDDRCDLCKRTDKELGK